jgi:peptide/nickel transport system permease protein
MENRMQNMTVLAKIWNAIKLFFGKMYSNPKTAIGFTVILCYLLIAVIGPRLFPYDSMVNASNKYLPASWEHPFGTDWMGLDVFRQVLAGTEGVLQVAFYTAVISIFMGTVLGILSGYIGGWVDRVIMVIVNIFLSVPSFPVYLMLAALLTIETPMAMAVVISVFSWAGLCRAIRVQVISLKESDFIQICRVMNMSTGHIIFKEIMPNLFSYIAVNFVLILRGSILASVGIMLVGLASYNPTDWGVIIQAARMRGLMNLNNVRIMLYPLAAILIFQIAALMLAQGLDETFNPRLKVL